MSLDAQTCTNLLRLARNAIESELFGAPPASTDAGRAALPAAGAFVTLRKRGQLRGCIGTFDTSRGLIETIQTMAVSAAHDPRFAGCPIGAAEFVDIDIELSILSPLERIKNPLDFELGRHGILVRSGGHSGCFLPDVATERKWTREQFLDECCSQKAGMGKGGWRKPNCEVFVFTVEKIHERHELH
ncbi:MAG: AmmeMemoRadiSam system protein A [Planctomycetia bacterium]|nr:AmmeMemoRadiSam system protein A [Planctomycetia bacterium]MCC7313283.1 AmmeMemoRadiSam system protein A [Planctomycetota bacterium]